MTMRRNKLASLHQGVKKDLRIDFMTLALHGNKITFDKVIKMIDAMVETLKKEQKNDDYKKEYCTMQLDLKDGKRKAVSRALSDAETAIESAKQLIATLTEELAALESSIKALDTFVTEANGRIQRVR